MQTEAQVMIGYMIAIDYMIAIGYIGYMVASTQ